MNQREAQQLPNQDFRPSGRLHPEMRLVDPASGGNEVGPKLQSLMDQIGVTQQEELKPDLLWTTTAQVEPMTPEEIEETMNRYADEEPYAADPYINDSPEVLSPLVGGIPQQQLTGSLISQNLEETKEYYEPEQVGSIVEQWQNENLDNEQDPVLTFTDLQAFTADVISQDLDAMENRIEEIALDVGIAFDNMTGKGGVDLLYLTSVSFLVVITIAIISALWSYKQMLKNPAKGGNRQSARSMANSLLGRDPEAGVPQEPANRDAAADGAGAQRGLAELAFDLMTDPMSAFRQSPQKANNTNSADRGAFGSPPPNEISRLSLHYSSANMSEEESSSLINILDRKKYNDAIAATRSSEDQNQPSFFEKISTGSNTDSDLRVVRFDGMSAKEQQLMENVEKNDEDQMPKFRKPVPSKNQLTQQQLVTDAANQRRLQQQQQLLLFEDFSTEGGQHQQQDMQTISELYQHKQQQNLQAYLSQTNFLSEDRPQSQTQEKQLAQSTSMLNHSMASTQQDSELLDQLPDTTNVTPKQANQKSEQDGNQMIYEQQRDYYFGGNEAARTLTTDQKGGDLYSSSESQQQLSCPDGMHGSSILSNEDSSLLENDVQVEGVKQLPVVPVNASIATNQPLDSIVELNYEASSDEELLQTQEVI